MPEKHEEKQNEKKKEEPKTYHQLRLETTRDLREVMDKLLKEFQPIDGYAIAIIKEDRDGHGSTMHMGSDMSTNLFGVEAASDVAAKAIADLMEHFGLTWEEAEASFKTRVFEKYRTRIMRSKPNALLVGTLATNPERIVNLFKVMPGELLEKLGPPPKEALEGLPSEVAEKIMKTYEDRLVEFRANKEKKQEETPAKA